MDVHFAFEDLVPGFLGEFPGTIARSLAATTR
jgi:hypothetical protein